MEIPGQNVDHIPPQPMLGALQANNLIPAPTPAQLQRFRDARFHLIEECIAKTYHILTPTLLRQGIEYEARLARDAIEHRDVVYLLKIACFLTLFIGCAIKEIST